MLYEFKDKYKAKGLKAFSKNAGDYTIIYNGAPIYKNGQCTVDLRTYKDKSFMDESGQGFLSRKMMTFQVPESIIEKVKACDNRDAIYPYVEALLAEQSERAEDEQAVQDDITAAEESCNSAYSEIFRDLEVSGDIEKKPLQEAYDKALEGKDAKKAKDIKSQLDALNAKLSAELSDKQEEQKEALKVAKKEVFDKYEEKYSEIWAYHGVEK